MPRLTRGLHVRASKTLANCAPRAIKHLPISLATPIRATAPLFTVIGALVLFGERPLTRQWLGIAIILLAYLAFSAIGEREGIVFRTDRWVAFLLAGTLIGSGSGLYDKYLLQPAGVAAVHTPVLVHAVWGLLASRPLALVCAPPPADIRPRNSAAGSSSWARCW